MNIFRSASEYRSLRSAVVLSPRRLPYPTSLYSLQRCAVVIWSQLCPHLCTQLCTSVEGHGTVSRAATTARWRDPARRRLQTRQLPCYAIVEQNRSRTRIYYMLYIFIRFLRRNPCHVAIVIWWLRPRVTKQTKNDQTIRVSLPYAAVNTTKTTHA